MVRSQRIIKSASAGSSPRLSAWTSTGLKTSVPAFSLHRGDAGWHQLLPKARKICDIFLGVALYGLFSVIDDLQASRSDSGTTGAVELDLRLS